MKKNILTLVTGSIFFASCMKEEFAPHPSPVTPCELQTANPSGKSYAKDSVAAYTCTNKHCGILPLSTRNYWVYQDSVFIDGEYLTSRLDTLRYTKTMQSPDGLVWWESNIYLGLPAKLYANDSSFFRLEERMFTLGILDAKKDFSLFPGDSLRYLASFDDIAAQGRSLRIAEMIKTAAGDFSDCLYFEKNARNYRKDQVIYKPGIGVLKYIQEKAPMGLRVIKLQQISTLIAYHIE
ncbi:MAG: hypothetical protein ABIR30_13025 [Chitinophagaceae bacterium]